VRTVINGYVMNYETAGEGPALLHIHGGLGGMLSTLAPQEFLLAQVYSDAFRVVWYDRRSAGQSDYPEVFYSLEDVASDAKGLLDHLGIDKAVIMGDSAGGPVALTFALNYPERAYGLVLAETSAVLCDIPAFAPTLRELVEMLRNEGPEAAYEARKRLRGESGGEVGDLSRVFDFSKAPPVIEEFFAAQVREGREKARLASREERIRWHAGELRNYTMYLGVDLRPRLKEVRMPTCVIHGNKDIAVPLSHGQIIAAEVPDAELHIIENVQHGIMLAGSAQRALRQFMVKVTA